MSNAKLNREFQSQQQANALLQQDALKHELHLRTVEILGRLITPQSTPEFISNVETVLLQLIKPFQLPDVNQQQSLN